MTYIQRGKHVAAPYVLLAFFLMASSLAAPAARAQQQGATQPAGQTNTNGSSQTTSAAQAETPGKNPDPSLANTAKNDRLFGVIPNYTTVENEDKFGPMSAKGKFKMAADSVFDPYTFPFIGFVALIGQAENSEPSYGQGFEGYAKRYGTSFADAGIGTTMTVAVFPSLLHQDSRYFQLGRGSVGRRTMYAVSRIFVTRADSGSHQFNASEIVGNLAAAGISNAYHPAEDRGVGNTLSIWGTDIMWDTVANVLKEFWPDIRRKVHKKHDDS